MHAVFLCTVMQIWKKIITDVRLTVTLLIFRETVSLIFLASVMFASETLILVSEQLSSSTDNLLISYHDKLAKWKQGVFDSR